MIHALITLAICGALYVLQCPWLAFFYPAAFYVGREVAQAEYRYIESHGKKRANCPSWCGFIPSAWTLKGILDWACPLIVSGAFAAADIFGLLP